METLPIPAPARPSDYERRAWREIDWWKRREMGWFGAMVGRVNRAVSGVTGLLRRVPGVEWVVDELAPGLLRLTNEITQDTVGREAIYRSLRERGLAVREASDVARQPLEALDEASAGLRAKYRALAAAEGAVAGYAGLAGIVPDVFALVALNLRAAGETAVYYGFEIDDPAERLFALQILDLMSHPSDAAKQMALGPVIRVSRRMMQDQASQAAQQYAVTRAIQNVARTLGLHLTEAKLLQVVPVTGALIGGGFNAYYTSKVADAAHFLYRERFLVRRYGPDVMLPPRP